MDEKRFRFRRYLILSYLLFSSLLYSSDQFFFLFLSTISLSIPFRCSFLFPSLFLLLSPICFFLFPSLFSSLLSFSFLFFTFSSLFMDILFFSLMLCSHPLLASTSLWTSSTRFTKKKKRKMNGKKKEGKWIEKKKKKGKWNEKNWKINKSRKERVLKQNSILSYRNDKKSKKN